MLSLITGKTGLAALAVCLGLAVAWVVKEPANAGDGDGKGKPVIDTTLEALEQKNDRLVAMLEKGDESSGGAKQESGGGDNDDQPEDGADEIALQPAQPIRFSAVEREIFQELSSQTRMEFPGIPLRDALTSLGAQHEIQIVIDDVAIEEQGSTVDNNVDMFLEGITLKSALNLLLDPEELAYHVEDEVLKITSRDALKAQVATRAYYIPETAVSDSSEALTERIRNLLTPTFPLEGEQPPVIEIFDDRLIIAGTLEDHKKAQEILRLIFAEPSASPGE